MIPTSTPKGGQTVCVLAELTIFVDMIMETFLTAETHRFRPGTGPRTGPRRPVGPTRYRQPSDDKQPHFHQETQRI